MIQLDDYQLDAISKLKNGNILFGRVGSGKSRTGIAYFMKEQNVNINDICSYVHKKIKDLYIITTARKRDEKEWEDELIPFLLSSDPSVNRFSNKVIVDSWNNISKYVEVKDSFFIFDEQRLIGSGTWVKAFYKIAKANNWILLTATPGDKWSDYIPVFVANGFYKNKTDFMNKHAVFNRYSKFPKIDKYIATNILNYYRRQVLVSMKYKTKNERVQFNKLAEYDSVLYKAVQSTRKNPETGLPFKNASEFCFALRKIVNSDPSRLNIIRNILSEKDRVIIFYNYDFELLILRTLSSFGYSISEWNGKKHDPVPKTKKWVYLVQYNSGSEAWNCKDTDTMIFYSLNYSYRIMEQASGRIDRRTTPYDILNYYYLKSQSPIDLSIERALRNKKTFNEREFYDGLPSH